MQLGWEVATDFGEYGLRKGAVGEELAVVDFTSKMREYGWPERFVESMICAVEGSCRGGVTRNLSSQWR